MISLVFDDIDIYQHFSPIFLGRQHYDIFIPKYNIAIEYQGIQHTQPVDFFGGQAKFEDNLKRDQRKKDLSFSNGIYLIEVFPGYSMKDLITQISEQIGDLNYVTHFEQLKFYGDVDYSTLKSDISKRNKNLNQNFRVKKSTDINYDDWHNRMLQLENDNNKSFEDILEMYLLRITHTTPLNLTVNNIIVDSNYIMKTVEHEFKYTNYDMMMKRLDDARNRWSQVYDYLLSISYVIDNADNLLNDDCGVEYIPRSGIEDNMVKSAVAQLKMAMHEKEITDEEMVDYGSKIYLKVSSLIFKYFNFFKKHKEIKQAKLIGLFAIKSNITPNSGIGYEERIKYLSGY